MAELTMTHMPKTPFKQRFARSLHTDSGIIHVLSQLPEKGDSEFLYLRMHVSGAATISHKGTQVSLEPGDLVFCDHDRPHVVQSDGDCQVTVFRVSKRHLGVSESDLRHVVGVPVRGGEGVGALVSVFLSSLAVEEELHGSRIGDRLARSAVDMLAVLVMELCTEGTGTRRETADAADVSAETLARIRAFIDEHLMDPDLSPQSVADAHHISVRYLHKLFENEGTTVSQWVRQRRLEFCRHDLGRLSHRKLTVAAVARRWGFRSASHFSRVFRDAYGMSPREWQACA
ncbi:MULTISPECIES: helix-turn-helix domain-containing protein [unclassified Streptomyces]|uniref:helix-turn-helix domain-containing protein n=1 Tax=unclassified Streptomyces TaxID=2593676 RepID=UPI002E81F3CE|nr:helix-turn-helix domain-containing protein [Streptomyces sp. NBC_00589]WTI41993.1 helix-turn-helix domain-containing protein [Streptomyces sp. NBC_00775]WUB24324.1 helix-turn-helix domain-containing protein [Streptomyces sp. NBC_00589]